MEQNNIVHFFCLVRLVNGFSNLFWGWGGEDDDMANRLRIKKLFISRYPANIARYREFSALKGTRSRDRQNLIVLDLNENLYWFWISKMFL
jgi:hypothetical protein